MTYAILAPLTLLAGLALAGCSASAGVSDTTPPAVGAGAFSCSPTPAEAGEILTISGPVSNLAAGPASASWTAIRDSTVSVASGTLDSAPGGGAVTLAFTDTILLPGPHSYAIRITGAGGGTSLSTLDVPVAYHLSPSLQQASDSSTQQLVLTFTNNGSGTVGYAVPYSLTDTQGTLSATTRIFDFSGSPLAPGSSASETVTISPPAGNDTYILTVDPMGTLGVNLAGAPASASLPYGSG